MKEKIKLEKFFDKLNKKLFPGGKKQHKKETQEIMKLSNGKLNFDESLNLLLATSALFSMAEDRSESRMIGYINKKTNRKLSNEEDKAIFNFIASKFFIKPMEKEKIKNGNDKKFLRIYDLLMGYSGRFYKFIIDCLDTSSLLKDSNGGRNYGVSTLFEICIYFLFRLDFSLVVFRQKYDTRKKLFLFCVENLKKEFENKLENNNLNKIIDNRMDGYGKIVRKWNKEIKIEDLHFCLLELIKQAKNNNKLEFWDFEKGPITIMDVFKEIPLKSGLMGGEKAIMIAFSCALKRLFKDNDDFILLSLNEINKRINER